MFPSWMTYLFSSDSQGKESHNKETEDLDPHDLIGCSLRRISIWTDWKQFDWQHLNPQGEKISSNPCFIFMTSIYVFHIFWVYLRGCRSMFQFFVISPNSFFPFLKESATGAWPVLTTLLIQVPRNLSKTPAALSASLSIQNLHIIQDGILTIFSIQWDSHYILINFWGKSSHRWT